MNIIGSLGSSVYWQYFRKWRYLPNLGDKKLAKVRNNQIGWRANFYTELYFQNVELPLIYAGCHKEVKNLAKQYLKNGIWALVWLTCRQELSGDRSSDDLTITRALVNNPSIIAPTSRQSLDTDLEQIMELLMELNAEEETIIMVLTNLKLLPMLSVRVSFVMELSSNSAEKEEHEY